MLRKEIMTVLPEEGSECIGNPMEIKKYGNVDNLPKTDPLEFIFGPQLDIDERDSF